MPSKRPPNGRRNWDGQTDRHARETRMLKSVRSGSDASTGKERVPSEKSWSWPARGGWVKWRLGWADAIEESLAWQAWGGRVKWRAWGGWLKYARSSGQSGHHHVKWE